MFVLGITGGIGCGKSTVSNILKERGLPVLDADAISRSVTGPSGIAVPEIAEVFGKSVVAADGSLNRVKTSNIVFRDNRKLDLLSQIIHKYVFIEMESKLEKLREKKEKCVVLDVPIPVKKFVSMTDMIWVVTCDMDIRLQRLSDRGMNREDAERRIASQLSDEEYASLGDFTVDNSGSPDDLQNEVEKLIVSQLHERGIRI